MLTRALTLFLVVAAVICVGLGDLPLPSDEPTMLMMASGAMDAILQSTSQYRCCLMTFTDGRTSSTSKSGEEFGRLAIAWGVGVFEVAVAGQDANTTQTQFSWLMDEARRLRQVSWCVTVVVVSDDPVFLASFAQWSLKGRLLVWSTRLLVVTSLPVEDLHYLHKFLSMTNSILLIAETNKYESPRCSAYLYLPYAPQGVKPLKVAFWTPLRELILTTDFPLFPSKFSRLSYGPTLVVAAEEYEPHIALLKEKTTPDAPLFTGPMVNLLKILADTMNFSYTYARPPDGSWGAKLEDGSWTGMVGMVGREEADIGLGPFGVSATRAEMIDYTKPILIDYARIMAGRGLPEIDPWGFLLPLAPLVWAAVLTALVVLPTVVFLMSSCSGLKNTNERTWSSSMFAYTRVLMQQDTMVSSYLWWERLVLAAWMLMTLVLTRSYAGTLMALLAVRHIPQTYQSLRHVLDDPSVTMLWEGNNAYVQYYRSVKSGTFREVADSEHEGRITYVRSTEFPNSMNTLVRRGDHVLIAEDLYGRVLMAQDFSRAGQCDFYASREVFLPFMFAMVGQKNSPLVPVISERIKTLIESGLYSQWMEDAIPNSTSCLYPPTKITVNTSLSVHNIWGMFVVLAGGHAISLLVLVLELLSSRLLHF